jgi:hypothetical protein
MKRKSLSKGRNIKEYKHTAASFIIQKQAATLFYSSAWLVARTTEFLLKHVVFKQVRMNTVECLAVTSNTGATERLFAAVV